MNIWQILGTEPTDEVAKIRRAYAQQLKQHRPDNNPQGYQRLREAFEQAKAMAESGLLAVQKECADETTATEDIVTHPESGFAAETGSEEFCTAPEQSAEPLAGELPACEPVWTAAEISELADKLADSEVRGAAALEALWSRVARSGSLAQQQLFHQALGRALAALPGLTEGLLESVSARLDWGLDEYESARVLGPQIVAALEDQLRETELARGRKQLKVESESGSFLHRISNRLLQSERRSVPFWMRLVPGLVQETTQQVNRLSHYYPELLNRLNPVLVSYVLQPRLAVSWAGIFLCLFWGAIFLLVLPAPGVQSNSLKRMAMAVFFFLFVRDAMWLGLSRWGTLLSYYLTLEYIVSILGALMGATLVFGVAWGLVTSTETGGKELMAGSALVFTFLIYWWCWPKDEPLIRKPGEMLGRLFASPWRVLKGLGFPLPGIVIVPLYFLLWFIVMLALVRQLSLT